MDLVCLILWIIDLFKPSIGLSIAAICTGAVNVILLCIRNKDFSIAYVVSLIGIVVGIVKILVTISFSVVSIFQTLENISI